MQKIGFSPCGQPQGLILRRFASTRMVIANGFEVFAEFMHKRKAIRDIQVSAVRRGILKCQAWLTFNLRIFK